jgi:acetyl esterase/lipase
VTALALLLALIVLAIAPWAQIPAPKYLLLPLSVGAPEMSAWLLALALLALLLSVIALRRAGGRRSLRKLALVLSLIAAAFPTYVLAQIPAGLRRMDAEWQRAFNSSASAIAPIDQNSMLRSSRVSWREAFFGLRVPSVRITRAVPVRTVGGVNLTVDIYRPAHDGMAPTVVQIYGGAWRGGAPGSSSRPAQALAASGFVVFAIDYRHAPDWTWPSQLEDVLDALRWVSAHSAEYGADPTRMALLGRSAGAQLAMRASQDSAAPPIRAVVSIYGPVDLADGYRSPPRPDPIDTRFVLSQFLDGTPDQRPDAYADASPITRAGLPHPPVLIITGNRDHIVDPRFGPMLHRKLLESGTSVFLNMPWADHAFDLIPFGPSSQIALYYTQRFLAQTLR